MVCKNNKPPQEEAQPDQTRLLQRLCNSHNAIVKQAEKETRKLVDMIKQLECQGAMLETLSRGHRALFDQVLQVARLSKAKQEALENQQKTIHSLVNSHSKE